MQAGDSAAHGTPSQVLLGASFFGTIDAEVVYVVDGRLPAQKIADCRERLVIERDRIPAQPMLDPHPFLAALHIAGQLGRKPARAPGR